MNPNSNKPVSRDQIVKDFEQQLKEALTTAKFPSDKIEPAFICAGVMAFQHKSIMGIGCDVETYQKAVDSLDPGRVPDWDLFTISFVINTIETAKPVELGMSINKYAEVIAQTRRMAAVWNELVQPIREELTIKNMPQKKPGLRLVPSTNKKRNGSRG